VREYVKYLPRPDSGDLLDRLRPLLPGSRWTATRDDGGLRALSVPVQDAEARIFQQGSCVRYEQRRGRINSADPLVKRLPGNGVKDHWVVDIYPVDLLEEQDVLGCLSNAGVELSAVNEDAPVEPMQQTELPAALEVLDSGAFAEPADDGGYVHLFYDRLQRQRQVRMAQVNGHVVLQTPVIRGADAEGLRAPEMRSQRRCVDAFCGRLNAGHGLAFLRTERQVLIRGAIPRSVHPAERLARAVQQVVKSMTALHDQYFFPLVGLLDADTARAVMRLHSHRQRARAQGAVKVSARPRRPRPVDRLEEFFRAMAQKSVPATPEANRSKEEKDESHIQERGRSRAGTSGDRGGPDGQRGGQRRAAQAG